jgi:hypothetical protein
MAVTEQPKKEYNQRQIEYISHSQARDNLTNAIIPHYLKLRDKGPVLLIAEIRAIMMFAREYDERSDLDVDLTKSRLIMYLQNSPMYDSAARIINQIDFEDDTIEPHLWRIGFIHLSESIGKVL